MSEASRILIVDDAPANLQALSAILRERRYQISVATNGRQALDVLARVRPDLILLDVLMPEMDGFQTCAAIKAVADWRDIPIIFLTAKTETDDIVRGFELGAVDYVAKPFHAHELLARVHTHLSMDRLRRENERLVRDESELARHRSVAQMVAGVAHELNTPLGVINTAADLIGKRLAEPVMATVAADSEGSYILEDLRDAASLIGRNTARAAKLVQDFKKVSVNQITDVLESIALADLLAETAHLFRVSERQSRMEVAIENALGDVRWVGYAGSLSQVLLNLLSNAQRYAYLSGVGGRVDILLDLDPDAPGRYRIRVRDHGQGIAAEHLPRIFEPFYTTGRGKGGSGLGLSIVYNIVTVHLKGSIRVESTPGTGSCFTVCLPHRVDA